jgi:type IV fimbrial biogenesis protein FimT
MHPNEEVTLGRSAKFWDTQRNGSRGFSMVELAVSLSVALILTAVAIPSLMRSFRTYQLNDAAARLSDQLKFTRFEAVRRNTTVSFLMRTSGSGWIVGTDSNNNGTFEPTEKQLLISGFATLLPSGAPPASTSITATLGGASSLNTKSGAPGAVAFDARGAVSPLETDVWYLGSAANPEFGYRAVILLPSGAVQIWTAQAGGTWQRIG